MSKQNGFTLLELVTTVAVAAIVMSMGVPSMVSLVRGNQTVANTNDLVATVRAARNEAVSSVEQVTVCTSSDQATCNNSGSWTDGWIAFVDTNQNMTRELGGTPEVLIVAHDELGGSNSLSSAAFDNWIAFRPTGLAIGSTANTGTFNLCNEAGAAYGRDINITRTGSSSIAESGEGSC